MSERALPSGTITFLATDIVGSTRLVQDIGPGAFRRLLEEHNRILRTAISRHAGTERGTEGDSFLVMFRNAPAAVSAAAEAQVSLAATAWPRSARVAVRMGLHTGLGLPGGDDYVGIDVHRAARISAAAHGGQVLVSDATRALVEGDLPPGASLRALGEHKLRDIARPERLFQLVIEGLPSRFPPISTAEPVAGNLPPRLTGFIGRDAELGELGELLDTQRLVTLTGPGGTGKSSLALEMARGRARAFDGGAWFVPLDAISDPDLVAPAISTGLGLLESPGASTVERVIDYLRDRSTLLVLDNFEQLLPAASLVADLLNAAPRLRAVVTSRAPLHLAAEQEYPVPPLALPAALGGPEDARSSPAVQLFVERARRVQPGFELTAEDMPAVVEICRRLDGLPLAIELAASRVTLLPPRAIADRLADRLDLPGTAARDRPERQQSMDRAVAWSYELLEAPARRLLDRLSVFRGGCRLEEAEAVCGPSTELAVDVLDGLSVLVDHSLVRPVRGPDGARFSLLDTIRMFAARQLDERGETPAITRRHATAFLVLAEAAAPHLPGGQQLAWLRRLAAEHDNERAAVRWAIDNGETETALRLAAALWRFWHLDGHLEEGRAEIDRILAMPGADAPSLPRMRALDAAGGVAWWMGDVADADARYQAQLGLARSLGDAQGTADALFSLMHTRPHIDGDIAAFEQRAGEAIAIYRSLGDERSIARVEWAGVGSRLARGEAVEDDVRGALERFEALGDDWYIATARGMLAWILFQRGDIAGAQRWFLLAEQGGRQMGDVPALVIWLWSAAAVLLRAGQHEAAATTQGAATELRRRYGLGLPRPVQLMFPAISRDQFELDDARYAGCVAQGAAMSLDEALDFVEQLAAVHAVPAP